MGWPTSMESVGCCHGQQCGIRELQGGVFVLPPTDSGRVLAVRPESARRPVDRAFVSIGRVLSPLARVSTGGCFHPKLVRDSNPRLSGPQPDALPAELTNVWLRARLESIGGTHKCNSEQRGSLVRCWHAGAGVRMFLYIVDAIWIETFEDRGWQKIGQLTIWKSPS